MFSNQSVSVPITALIFPSHPLPTVHISEAELAAGCWVQKSHTTSPPPPCIEQQMGLGNIRGRDSKRLSRCREPYLYASKHSVLPFQFTKPAEPAHASSQPKTPWKLRETRGSLIGMRYYLDRHHRVQVTSEVLSASAFLLRQCARTSPTPHKLSLC